jgi:hypothetical protein
VPGPDWEEVPVGFDTEPPPGGKSPSGFDRDRLLADLALVIR